MIRKRKMEGVVRNVRVVGDFPQWQASWSFFLANPITASIGFVRKMVGSIQGFD